MYKAVMFLVLSLLSTSALADGGVYLHGTSYHSKYTSQFNRFNKGLGVYVNFDDNKALEIGAYTNSFHLTSHYVTVQHKLLESKKIHTSAGLQYSLVSGYPVEAIGINTPVLPLVAPYAELGRLRVVLLPDPTMLILGFSVKLL